MRPGTQLKKTMRKVLARHHVVELEGIVSRRAASVATDGGALRRLCDDAALHVVNRVRHEFTPHGLTIVFVLRESRWAYGSWPERGAPILDLFRGSVTPTLGKAIARFARAMGARKVRVRNFPVGPLGP